MGSKFLVSSKAIFFSTHGEIYIDLIFSAFNKKELRDDFKLAGFYHNTENLSTVKNIEKVSIKKYYLANLSGVGIKNSQSMVYTDQKFINTNGDDVLIKDVKPNDLIVSLNGHTTIECIRLINEDMDFYILECEKDMPNLYIDNIIMLPITEEEINKGFFIKSKAK